MTVLALLVPVCAVASAGATVDAGGSLRFGFVPQRAFVGQPASIAVVVRLSRAVQASLSSIPADRASTAGVSVAGRYEPVG